MTESLGKHILVEYYDCDEQKILNYKSIEKLMNKASELAGATIVDSVFHNFNPYGVSGAVIIKESHLTIHTWPEYKYAAVDIFTCGDSVDPKISFEFLKKEFNAKRVEFNEVLRGKKEQIIIN